MPRAKIFFHRVPSEALRDLFKPEGVLSPLLCFKKNWNGRDVKLDVQFRRGNKVDFYFGLTTLTTLKWLARKRMLRVLAYKTHRLKYRERHGEKGVEELFREWVPGNEFRKKLQTYLRDVEVDGRHILKEGSVQLKWSGGVSDSEPWITFDREARLEYESRAYREEIKQFGGVEGARDDLKDSRREEYGLTVDPPTNAEKLDRLSVDSDGNLVLTELKSNEGKREEIYYAPFQLLQYVWEWYSALKNWPNLLEDVQALLDSRVCVKLAPKPNAPLTGRIRAAVCFGSHGPKDDVARSYRFVLETVNKHLPDGVSAIETWTYREGPKPWGDS